MAVAPQQMVDTGALRYALGHFVTGVTIVTTVGPDGEPVGMTANAFTSVSLDPPLVVISVARSASTFAAMEDAAGYAVHVLRNDQAELASAFAKSAGSGADKFVGIGWHVATTGLPCLDEYLARFECTTVDRVAAGDHVLYLGQVDDLSVRADDGEPLAFFRGRYHRVS